MEPVLGLMCGSFATEISAEGTACMSKMDPISATQVEFRQNQSWKRETG